MILSISGCVVFHATTPALICRLSKSHKPQRTSLLACCARHPRLLPPPARPAQVHRTMVAEEEYKLLKMARINRKLDAQKGIDSQERSACLVALYPADQLAGGGEGGDEPIDSRLLVDSTSGSSGNGSGGSGGLGSRSSPVRGGGAASEAQPAPGQLAVVGTLDLHAVRALPGEVLIGNSQNAAYLANVCTANAARRRGVGAALLQEARRLAARWGEAAAGVQRWAGVGEGGEDGPPGVQHR